MNNAEDTNVKIVQSSFNIKTKTTKKKKIQLPKILSISTTDTKDDFIKFSILY